MIEAVLFDLGDTLVHFDETDPGRLLRHCGGPVHAKLLELGHNPPPLESYLRYIRWECGGAYLVSRVTQREVQLARVIQRAHARMNLNFDLAYSEELLAASFPALESLFTKDPQANDVIAELSGDGYRLGIVSNTWLPASAVKGYLDHQALSPFFETCVYSSAVRYMKPHREVFRCALGAMNINPERTVFVGDRLDNDVMGAARVGMRTILCLHEHKMRRFGSQPDRIIRELREIPQILREGFGDAR